MKSVVYFVRRADGTGLTKIGVSAYLDERVRQLARECKAPLVVLATAPGSFREERRMHQHLAEHRVTGEWFAHTPEIEAVIANVLATGALPVTPETGREETMGERYLAGETLREIGAAYGLTRERVRQLLRKAGVPSLGHRAQHKNQPHPLTAVEIEAARLYEIGTPPKALTERFGIEYFQLRLVLKRLGIAPKGVAHWNRRQDDVERTAEICRLYQSGTRPDEIRERLGLKYTTHVYRYLRKGGIATNNDNRRGQIEARAGEIVPAYRAGATVLSLVQQYGFAADTIERLLDRHGARRTREQSEAIRIASVRRSNAARAGRIAA